MNAFFRTSRRGLLGAVVVHLGCMSPSSLPQTGKEFIHKYSRAYERGDVSALLDMTQLQKGQGTDALKASIANEISHQGFEYVAWTHTRYLSEEDRGKYIKVGVRVDEAVSSIILVRTADGLKVSQYPEAYEP